MHYYEIENQLRVRFEAQMAEKIKNRESFLYDLLRGVVAPKDDLLEETVASRLTPKARAEFCRLLAYGDLLYVVYSGKNPIAYVARESKAMVYVDFAPVSAYANAIWIDDQARVRKLLGMVYPLYWENADGKTCHAFYEEERDRDLRIIDLVVVDKATNVRIEE
jgi:hypothetical protein